jgi:hypothetical protein
VAPRRTARGRPSKTRDDRVADLQPVDLIVAIQVEIDTRERRVIGEPHAVRRQEASRANPKSVVGLVRNPVLVGNERGIGQGAAVTHRRIRRLAPDRAIRRPPILLDRTDEIEIHQKIHILMATRESHVETGRTRFQPEVRGAERIPQRAIQECLLTVRVVLRARGRTLRIAAGRR